MQGLQGLLNKRFKAILQAAFFTWLRVLCLRQGKIYKIPERTVNVYPAAAKAGRLLLYHLYYLPV